MLSFRHPKLPTSSSLLHILWLSHTSAKNPKRPELDRKCYASTGTLVFLIKKACPPSCLDFFKQIRVGTGGELHQAQIPQRWWLLSIPAPANLAVWSLCSPCVFPTTGPPSRHPARLLASQPHLQSTSTLSWFSGGEKLICRSEGQPPFII